MKHAILKIILLFIPCSSIIGQEFLRPNEQEAIQFGVNQGLSQGMVSCIYQDKEGYMWICTKDGLNRYDGYKIVIYRHNSDDLYSLTDNYCNSITEDDNGNFWVGTNTKGLLVFNKATERFFPVSINDIHSENLSIRELVYSKGKLFVKTVTDALILDVSYIKMKPNGMGVFNAKLLFQYNRMQYDKRYSMEVNSLNIYTWNWMQNGSLWVGFVDSVFCFKPSTNFLNWSLKTYSPASLGIDKKHHGPVSVCPIIGDENNMVVHCDKYIVHYNNITGHVIFKSELPVTNASFIKTSIQKSDGILSWFKGSIIFNYNPLSKNITTVSINEKQLLGGSLLTRSTDSKGIQWYGSSGFGVFKIDPKKGKFKSFTGANQTDVFWNMPAEFMPHIAPQLKGSWWVVLDRKGIYWTCLQQNHGNYLWKLYSYNTVTKQIHPFQSVLSLHIGVNIYNDPKDRLWIYYQNTTKKNYIAQINKANGTILETYVIPETIESPESYVTQFFLDNNNLMWLATINGLYEFNCSNKTWRHWKNIPGNNTSISADGVLSICPDPISPERYLWLGTDGAGINRFEKKTGNCVHYDEKDGLANTVAYCILADSLYNLWISTNRGLSCFNPERKTFRNFSEEDGLPGNEFNRYNALRMQNGELMFGGVNGFVVFNPKEVLQSQAAAPLVFTSVSILNKPVDWKNDSNNLKAPIGLAKTLTLMPGQNVFNISFSTLEFRSNAKKMYKYKLEGFDKEWSTPTNKNDVTYTNLAPGTYTLYVMGANTDGVWNNIPIQMQIIVKAFWYQTLLFKLAMLLLLFLATYMWYRYRLKQNLKLEKLRNRIARDLHDEIGSTLSSISFYAESVKKISEANPKAVSVLTKIGDGTSDMMEAMSDIVWAVNTGSDHIEGLANRLRSFAVQLTEVRQIELLFTENRDIPNFALDMEQRKNMYLISKEAISNAVKYAQCTVLDVSIHIKQQHLYVQIKDNGTGFIMNDAGNKASARSFGGNGIKNMKSRAVEIDAYLEINTQPGNGTCIVLQMPIKKS